MTRLAVALAFLVAVGCKREATPDRSGPPEQVPPMPEIEVQRSHEACKIYVERVCACAATVPDAVEPCKLAPALPDAVRIGLEVAASLDSKPDVVRQAYASVRKTAKECFEQAAKLATLGCP